MSSIIIMGLTGQLAWTVVNLYLNVFVYDTISDSPHVIALMVATSAICATLSAMVFGALSDKVGNRRPFIAVGYVIWGASTAVIGYVEAGGTLANIFTSAVIAVIALNCIMSLFGGGAYDASFNAWVTDSTNPGDRGRVDAVLQVLPLIAMLIVFGGLDGLAQNGEWPLFFTLIGAVTSAVGVLAWFLTRNSPPVKKSDESIFASLMYGLRPSTMRQHPALYVAIVAWTVISTSVQVFMPYIIIYMQKRLQLESYPLVLASVIVSASVISVLGGRVIDRVGKVRSILPAAGILVVGYVAIFFARTTVPVIIAGTVLFAGMMLTVAAIAATVRDATPVRHIGMVQGLRMIGMVLVPMVVGPFVGAWVISGAGETYVDLGVTKQVPTPWIFLAAAVIALLVVFPAAALRRLELRGLELGRLEKETNVDAVG